MSFHAKQTLKRDGVSVDLYRYETGEETSRGQPTTLTADSPTPINAIPDPSGKSLVYGLFGVEVDADMVYLVHEDVELEDGGGDGASRIVQDDDVWVVIDSDSSQPHGFQLLECERDTESDLL